MFMNHITCIVFTYALISCFNLNSAKITSFDLESNISSAETKRCSIHCSHNDLHTFTSMQKCCSEACNLSFAVGTVVMPIFDSSVDEKLHLKCFKGPTLHCLVRFDCNQTSTKGYFDGYNMSTELISTTSTNELSQPDGVVNVVYDQTLTFLKSDSKMVTINCSCHSKCKWASLFFPSGSSMSQLRAVELTIPSSKLPVPILGAYFCLFQWHEYGKSSVRFAFNYAYRSCKSKESSEISAMASACFTNTTDSIDACVLTLDTENDKKAICHLPTSRHCAKVHKKEEKHLKVCFGKNHEFLTLCRGFWIKQNRSLELPAPTYWSINCSAEVPIKIASTFVSRPSRNFTFKYNCLRLGDTVKIIARQPGPGSSGGRSEKYECTSVGLQDAQASTCAPKKSVECFVIVETWRNNSMVGKAVVIVVFANSTVVMTAGDKCSPVKNQKEELRCSFVNPPPSSTSTFSDASLTLYLNNNNTINKDWDNSVVAKKYLAIGGEFCRASFSYHSDSPYQFDNKWKSSANFTLSTCPPKEKTFVLTDAGLEWWKVLIIIIFCGFIILLTVFGLIYGRKYLQKRKLKKILEKTSTGESKSPFEESVVTLGSGMKTK